MPQQNLVSLAITDAEATQLAQAVNSLKTILGSRLISLTPEQRRELLKMGDTTRSYCAQTVNALNTHADSLPRALDLDELNADWSDFTRLETTVSQLRDFSEKLDDTFLALSSDIMTACTLGVGMLKAINRVDPALDSLLAELRTARRRSPKATPTAQAK